MLCEYLAGAMSFSSYSSDAAADALRNSRNARSPRSGRKLFVRQLASEPSVSTCGYALACVFRWMAFYVCKIITATIFRCGLSEIGEKMDEHERKIKYPPRVTRENYEKKLQTNNGTNSSLVQFFADTFQPSTGNGLV